MNGKKKNIRKRKIFDEKEETSIEDKKKDDTVQDFLKKFTNQNVGLATHLSFFDEIDHEIVCILCTYTYIIILIYTYIFNLSIISNRF